MFHEKRVNVARGTEINFTWLKVDWTDFISKNSMVKQSKQRVNPYHVTMDDTLKEV